MFTDWETMQVEEPTKALEFGAWCQQAPETCDVCAPFINRTAVIWNIIIKLVTNHRKVAVFVDALREERGRLWHGPQIFLRDLPSHDERDSILIAL